ncbi:MAG: DUF5615 family PIN-like protein [Runella sp.]
MLSFIIDTQLPPILALFLKEKGFDSTHTTDYPKAQFLSDAEIRTIAISEHRIIVTKDSDFVDYYWLYGSPPKILLVSCGNIRNKELLQMFEIYIDPIVDLFTQSFDLVCLSRDSIIAY